MGASADVARDILGYLYRVCEFRPDSRLWLVETPLPSQPHRPWVGRSVTDLLTTAIPSWCSSRVLFYRVLPLSYNSHPCATIVAAVVQVRCKETVMPATHTF